MRLNSNDPMERSHRQERARINGFAFTFEPDEANSQRSERDLFHVAGGFMVFRHGRLCQNAKG